MALQFIDPTTSDIVRDKDSGEHYVVSGILEIAAAQVIITGVSLINQANREWLGNKYSEANLEVVKRNLNLSPEEVYEQYYRTASKATVASQAMGKKEFINILNDPVRGRFFRELLLIEPGVVSATDYQEKLMDLAGALVGISKAKWTSSSIAKLLRDVLDEDEFDDAFINSFSEDFAGRISLHANSLKRPPKVYSSSDALLGILLNANRSPENSVLRVLSSPGSESKVSIAAKNMLERLASDKAGDQDLMLKFLMANKQENSAFSLFMKKLLKTTGVSENEVAFQLLEKGIIADVVSDIREGKWDSPLIQKIIHTQEFSDLSESWKSFVKIGQHANRRYGRRSSLGRDLGFSIINSSVYSNASYFQRMGESKVVAITKNELLNNYLLGAKVVANGKTYDLSKTHHLEAFSENVLKRGTPNMLISPLQMAEIIKNKKGVVNLDEMIEVDTALRKSIDYIMLQRLESAQGILGSQMSTRPIISFDYNLRNATATVSEEQLIQINRGQAVGTIGAIPELQKNYRRVFSYKEGEVRKYTTNLFDIKSKEKQINEIMYADLPRQYSRADIETKFFSSGAAKLFPTFDKPISNIQEVIGNYPIYNSNQSQNLVALSPAEAFKQEYESTKIGFTLINQEPRFIGTTLPGRVSAQDVLKRAQQVKRISAQKAGVSKTKVKFLDLETVPITVNGVKEWRISEISLISMSDLDKHSLDIEAINRDLSKRKLKTEVFKFGQTNLAPDSPIKTRVDSIIKLIEDLDDSKFILTQSANDYTFIANELAYLKRDGHISEQQYNSLLDRLYNAAEKKGVTTETIAFAAGKAQLGNASQTAMSRRLLGVEQTHVALLDNYDNYQLVKNFFEGDINVGVTGAVGVKVGLDGSKVRGLSGETVVIKSIRNLTTLDSLQEPKIQVSYETGDGVIRYLVGSQSEIANAFGKMRPINGNSPLEQLRQVSIEDQARRTIRQLNPMTLTIDYPYSSMGNQSIKSYGAHMFNVMGIADRLVDEKFSEGINYTGTQLDISTQILTKYGENNFALLRKELSDRKISLGTIDADKEALILGDVLQEVSAMKVVPQRRDVVRKVMEILGPAADRLFDIANNENKDYQFDTIYLAAMAEADFSNQISANVRFTVGFDKMKMRSSQILQSPESTLRLEDQMLNAYAELGYYTYNRGNSVAEKIMMTFSESLPKDVTEANLSNQVAAEFFGNISDATDNPELRQRADSFYYRMALADKKQTDTLFRSSVLGSLYDAAKNPSLEDGERQAIELMINNIREKVNNSLDSREKRKLKEKGFISEVGNIVREELKNYLDPDPERRHEALKIEYRELDVVRAFADEEKINRIFETGEIASHAAPTSNALIEEIEKLESEIEISGDPHVKRVEAIKRVLAARKEMVLPGASAVTESNKGQTVALTHEAVANANQAVITKGLDIIDDVHTNGKGVSLLWTNVNTSMMAITAFSVAAGAMMKTPHLETQDFDIDNRSSSGVVNPNSTASPANLRLQIDVSGTTTAAKAQQFVEAIRQQVSEGQVTNSVVQLGNDKSDRMKLREYIEKTYAER